MSKADVKRRWPMALAPWLIVLATLAAPRIWAGCYDNEGCNGYCQSNNNCPSGSCNPEQCCYCCTVCDIAYGNCGQTCSGGYVCTWGLACNVSSCYLGAECTYIGSSFDPVCPAGGCDTCAFTGCTA